MADKGHVMIPKDVPRWMYEAFRRLQQGQISAEYKFSAISRGEAPDGSGTTIVDLKKYFYLPGRMSGQIAYHLDQNNPLLTLRQAELSTAAFPLLKTMTDGQHIGSYLDGFTVACTTNGTTTVTTAASFQPSGGPTVVPGMRVTGTNIAAGTFVVAVASTTSLTISANATGSGATTLTFTAGLVTKRSTETETGKDIELYTEGGLRIQSAAHSAPLRIVGDKRAIYTGGSAQPIVNLETGYIASGTATGQNFQIGGPARGELAHMMVFTRTLSFSRNPASGSNINISMGALIPRDYGDASSGYGPASTLTVDIGSTNSAALTVAGNGSTAPVIDAYSSIQTSGTAPNKTWSRTNFIWKVTSNARMYIGNAAGGSTYQTSGADAWSLYQPSNDKQHLSTGRVAAWSDSLAVASSFYLQLGDLFTGATHRACFISSSGFGILSRFGVSASYHLISNGQAGGANFPSPDGSGSPSTLRVYNALTGGYDASSIVKIESARVGQSGNYLSVVDSTPNTFAGVNSSKKFFQTTGAVANYLAVCDANGVLTWTSPTTLSGLAGRLSIKANGPYQVDTFIDPVQIGVNATITGVYSFRGVAGSAGSTTFNIMRWRTGSPLALFASDKTAATYTDAAAYSVSHGAPGTTSLAAGDVLTLSITGIETDAEDLTIDIEFIT